MIEFTISKLLESDKGLNFLNYREQLKQKSQELRQGVSVLDSTLEGINRLPEEKAQGLSVLPIGNIATLIPIHKMTKAFVPAFKSSNSAYTSLRQITMQKLQLFLYVHIALVIVGVILSLPIDKNKKPLMYGLSLTYATSALVLFLKKNKITGLNSDSNLQIEN
jgi:hypothetical protein